MPKNFSDFSHRRSRTKHGSCQAVAKKVGSLELGVQVRAVECSANDRGQCRGTSKASAWRFRANEYSACSAVRAISTQVRGQVFAYIRREGHRVVHQPLALYEDYAGPPIVDLLLKTDP